MIRTQVYIPEDLYHRAKLLAEMEGISISELLRRGLESGVSQKKKTRTITGPFDKYLGVISLKGKKPVNAAMTHNDIYDGAVSVKPNRKALSRRGKKH